MGAADVRWARVIADAGGRVPRLYLDGPGQVPHAAPRRYLEVRFPEAGIDGARQRVGRYAQRLRHRPEFDAVTRSSDTHLERRGSERKAARRGDGERPLPLDAAYEVVGRNFLAEDHVAELGDGRDADRQRRREGEPRFRRVAARPREGDAGPPELREEQPVNL